MVTEEQIRNVWLRLADGMFRQYKIADEKGDRTIAASWIKSAIRAATIARQGRYSTFKRL